MRHYGSALLAALLGTAAISVPTVEAADTDGNYVIKGEGFETCETFTQALEDSDPLVLAFRSWINGHFSAVNLLTEGVYDISPVHNIDALTAIVANICDRTPQARFGEAVTATASLLRPLALAEQSERVDVVSGEESVSLPVELLRRAQERLAELELYDGEADGVFGPGTQAAISEFQEQNELEATGLPDLTTLVALLVPQS